MIKEKKNINFQLSFFILILFSIFLTPSAKLNYFNLQEGSIIKLIFNSYIYISLFFLPYLSFQFLNQFYNKSIRIIFYITLIYGLLKIFSNMDQFSLYISIFGNTHFGPVFLVPLYFLWGTKINAIYWFNKLGLFSIKAGIFLIPITMLFNLPLPTSPFLPIYYILAGYNHFSFKNKIWIILGVISAFYSFNITGYRSGIVVTLASILIFFVIKFKKKLLNNILILALISIPVIIFVNQLSDKQNIYEMLTNFFNPGSIWAVDTRSFLTKELINDLIDGDKILFGKGPLGSYYSETFNRFQFIDESLIYTAKSDLSTRYTSEIGFLHYLIKGGIFYLIIISILILLVIYNVQKNSKNDYLQYLSLFLAFYFMFSAVENPPLFNLKHISFWIILAICSSNLFVALDNNGIKKLIDHKIDE